MKKVENLQEVANYLEKAPYHTLALEIERISHDKAQEILSIELKETSNFLFALNFKSLRDLESSLLRTLEYLRLNPVPENEDDGDYIYGALEATLYGSLILLKYSGKPRQFSLLRNLIKTINTIQENDKIDELKNTLDSLLENIFTYQDTGNFRDLLKDTEVIRLLDIIPLYKG